MKILLTPEECLKMVIIQLGILFPNRIIEGNELAKYGNTEFNLIEKDLVEKKGDINGV